MKLKLLIGCFAVFCFLLLYSMACYHLLNKKIEDATRNSISNYFRYNEPDVDNYKYIKAVSNQKNHFQVFVEACEKYYTFNYEIENNHYELVNVVADVPSYIN